MKPSSVFLRTIGEKTLLPRPRSMGISQNPGCIAGSILYDGGGPGEAQPSFPPCP